MTNVVSITFFNYGIQKAVIDHYQHFYRDVMFLPKFCYKNLSFLYCYFFIGMMTY